MATKARLHSERAASAEFQSAASKPVALNPKLKLLFAALALFIAGFATARHVCAWPARLRYPGEVDPSECRVLADMVLLRQEEPV